MLIHLVRSGGFAGIRTEVTLDTESLPADEAKKIKEMLDSANFFNLPAKFASPKRGADYFQYKITVKIGEMEHTIELSETQIPEDVRPLLQSLMKYAKKQ